MKFTFRDRVKRFLSRIIGPWRLSQGEQLPPKWFGFAYYDFMACKAIFWAMPINWIVRFYWWSVWKWNEFRSRKGRMEYYVEVEAERRARYQAQRLRWQYEDRLRDLNRVSACPKKV